MKASRRPEGLPDVEGVRCFRVSGSAEGGDGGSIPFQTIWSTGSRSAAAPSPPLEQRYMVFYRPQAEGRRRPLDSDLFPEANPIPTRPNKGLHTFNPSRISMESEICMRKRNNPLSRNRTCNLYTWSEVVLPSRWSCIKRWTGVIWYLYRVFRLNFLNTHVKTKNLTTKLLSWVFVQT